jgi:hypothetical protein
MYAYLSNPLTVLESDIPIVRLYAHGIAVASFKSMKLLAPGTMLAVVIMNTTLFASLSASAKGGINLLDPVGSGSYCKVFSTGKGACDYESKRECELSINATDESCLPRVSKINERRERELCEHGNFRSCDKVIMKDSGTTDLVWYLGIPDGRSKFEKLTLYTGQAFEVIQKLRGGYLFTGSRSYFQGSMELKPAYLETKAKIPPMTRFCAWFYYIGDRTFTGIDGFERTVPAFRIYNGSTSRENPYCSLNGRLKDQ